MDKNGVEEKSRYLPVLIAFAYLFSLAVRYIWVDWASGIPEFFWNGQLMINTNDGYMFASGAQKALYGTLQHNPRVPGLDYTATVGLSYFVAKYLPWSLDTVILYMPAVISSLVVIPIILIGRLYRMTFAGFLAALLASVTWSYYNRTMAGYYDTDMFSAMVPMFIVYFLLAVIETHRIRYALLAALTLALYPYLYDQGKAMVFAISVLYIVYVWIFERRSAFVWPSIALVAAAMLPVFWAYKILAVLVVYGVLKSGKLNEKQTQYLALALSLIFLLFGDGLSFILHKIESYGFREETGQGLHFYNVVNTIREAGHIPFDLLARRISGSVPAFILAMAGYVILLMRNKAFVITLPLMGLGLFAWWGGLRFTVYAVPVAAIALVYFFYRIALYLRNERLRYLLMSLLTVAALYPNITHVIAYKVPTVFNTGEVRVLDALKKIGDDRDYVIAWWDYGYPIWYYADKNTLIDGGKHNKDNFIVSEILTTDSPLEAARLSRIAVETYVRSGYRTVADTLFGSGKSGPIDPNLYLENLKAADKVELPPKTREIYLFLPWRMSDIYPTVRLFSNIDLLNGKKRRHNLFLPLRPKGTRKDLLLFTRGAALDLKKGLLHLGREEAPLKQFLTVTIDKKGTRKVETKVLHKEGELTLVFAKAYERFFLMDERMYNSLYVQMFLLGRYDPELFEPVVRSPWAMVYRLKI